MIRTLVVDDSATMRALITAALRRDPAIDVVGEAASAHEARQAMKALNPDVVTLDIEMPAMNGLEFLEKIMRLRPTPVVMVSSLTSRGRRRRCRRSNSARSTAWPSRACWGPTRSAIWP